jgi:hypothetical protein
LLIAENVFGEAERLEILADSIGMFAYQSWLSRTSLRSPNKASVSSNRRIADHLPPAFANPVYSTNRIASVSSWASLRVLSQQLALECVTLLAARRRAVEGIIRN